MDNNLEVSKDETRYSISKIKKIKARGCDSILLEVISVGRKSIIYRSGFAKKKVTQENMIVIIVWCREVSQSLAS